MAGSECCERTTVTDRLIRAVGFAVASTYLLWNAWWIGHGRAAPSLFTGLTGLPCPTTGGTRSMQALARGDMADSLYYNPMTLPILIMLAVTLFALAVRTRRRERFSLPHGFLYAWAAVLLLAWGIKFVSPAATW